MSDLLCPQKDSEQYLTVNGSSPRVQKKVGGGCEITTQTPTCHSYWRSQSWAPIGTSKKVLRKRVAINQKDINIRGRTEADFAAFSQVSNIIYYFRHFAYFTDTSYPF